MATTKKRGGSSGKRGGSSSRKSSAKKSGGARGGASRKSSARRGGSSSRKSSGRKSGAKRTPNAAFMKPMQPSEELAQVVGPGSMPRTEVTKKLWAYIKRKGLQDAKERRMINADDALRPIFGGKRQVSMFDMTKMVNKHLREP